MTRVPARQAGLFSLFLNPYICSDPYAKFSRWPTGQPIGKAVNPLVYGSTCWPIGRLGVWVNPLTNKMIRIDSFGHSAFPLEKSTNCVLTNFSSTQQVLCCCCITLKVREELPTSVPKRASLQIPNGQPAYI